MIEVHKSKATSEKMALSNKLRSVKVCLFIIYLLIIICVMGIGMYMCEFYFMKS